YKAWLSDDPFVHLCGKRYIDRVEEVTKITVYSNLPEVELFANGVSLGKKEAPDHFFYFDVPNAGETKLVAVAGDLQDESMIRKVETFNNAYRLVEKSAVLNWFEVTEVEGHLSINDKMSTIMATEQGRALFGAVMAQFMPKEGEKVMGGFEMSGPMMDMMGGFTLLRLVGMMGMMGVNPSKEDLLALNAQLNQIKKP
ncbi:MAG: DUF4982 domain-containing protein, partial [Oscillospiraceae bacterium]|nr:DUF4982 domain-containing protein [Oscillospiraceae bacterium]